MSSGNSDGSGGSLTGGFDQLLDHLGTGRWTIFHCFVYASWLGCVSIQAFSGAFTAPLMNFTCRLPNITNNFHQAYNTTIIITPMDSCTYWVNSSEGSGWQERCTQWDFDHSTFGNTLTSEMLLVCGRAFLVPLYQSVYMFANCIGAVFGGLLSDRVGRRPVFVWGMVLAVVVAAGSSLLPNISLVLAARFVLGLLTMASVQAGFALVMEITRMVVRPVAGMVVLLPWALGLMVYGGLGYTIKHWRHLQLTTTLPFIIIFPALWLVGESPRWLLVRGKVQAAQQEFNRAARWHRVQPPPPHILSNIAKTLNHRLPSQAGVDATSYRPMIVNSWFHQRVLDLLILFRSPKLCIMTVVVCLNFFTSSLVYYGLSLSAVNFSADPFIYMSLSGLMEVPSYTMGGFVLARLGRKPPAIFCFLVTGLALMVLPFVNQGWVRMTLGLLGKLTINFVFSEFYIYASEIFATEMRLQGLGTGLMFARIGSIVSPFINDKLVPVYPWITPVVFGGLSVLAGLVTFLLPETKHTALQDITQHINHNPSATSHLGTAPEQQPRFTTEDIVPLTLLTT